MDSKDQREIVKYLRTVWHYNDVWVDEEIRGGQVWWNEILKHIADCDIFIYLLSNASLTSQYCQAEYKESKRLRKQFLPVVVRPDAPLPDEITSTHYIDVYDDEDTFRFANLLGSINILYEEIDSSLKPLSNTPTPCPNVPTFEEERNATPISASVIANLFSNNGESLLHEMAEIELDLMEGFNKSLQDFLKDRPFVINSFELPLIQVDVLDWVKTLEKEFKNDEYYPKTMPICNVPKKDNTVRPATVLQIKDQTIYNACVLECFKFIYEVTKWSEETVKFSNPLHLKKNGKGWKSKYWLRALKNCLSESLSRLDKGYKYVVFADITAFYENIDLQLLKSDLLSIGSPSSVVNVIYSCLQIWSQVQGRGLPQGYSSSDILAELYLNSIDKNLFDMGYSHIRWVDDFRIFCHTKAQAKQALIDLSLLLRKKGLNLHPSKTKIVTKNEAYSDIQGLTPELESLEDLFSKEFRQAVSALNLSGITFSEMDELFLSKQPLAGTLARLQEAYKTYIINNHDVGFDGTLFRFLLNRIGWLKSNFAVFHCLAILNKYPEHTNSVMKYFSNIRILGDKYIQSELATYLNSDEAIYAYQKYVIFKTFSDCNVSPNNEILYIARRITFDYSQPPYLVSVCRKYLSDFGFYSDLEMLETRLDYAQNELEECEIISCLKGLEDFRRNLLAQKYRSPLHQRAFKL